MNRMTFAAACLSMMLLGSGCKIVLTESSTYETCVSTADCASSFDSCISVSNEGITDSQCTRSCINDLDCPGAGHCVSFDGVDSYCYEMCVSNSACEPGWGCTELSDRSSVCLPGRGTLTPTGIPAYNECNPSSDACDASVEGCFTIQVDDAVAGVCTSSCSSSASCPLTAGGLRGECLSFDSGRSFTCFEACQDSGDCLEGFACKSSLADGSRFPLVCLPI